MLTSHAACPPVSRSCGESRLDSAVMMASANAIRMDTVASNQGDTFAPSFDSRRIDSNQAVSIARYVFALADVIGSCFEEMERMGSDLIATSRYSPPFVSRVSGDTARNTPAPKTSGACAHDG